MIKNKSIDVDSPKGWSSRFSVFFKSVPDTLKRELQRIPCFSLRDRSRINSPFGGSAVLADARHEEDVSPMGIKPTSNAAGGKTPPRPGVPPPLQGNVADLS